MRSNCEGERGKGQFDQEGEREMRFEEMRLLDLSSMEAMCSRMERECVFTLVKRELREKKF